MSDDEPSTSVQKDVGAITDSKEGEMKPSTDSDTASSMPPNAVVEKKKRTADRQLTKDDPADDDDDDETGRDEVKAEPRGLFPKADAETLSKRKIFKIKRPEHAPITESNNDNSQPTSVLDSTTSSSAEKNTTSKNTNPFANALQGFSTTGGFSSLSSSIPSSTTTTTGGFGFGSLAAAGATTTGSGFATLGATSTNGKPFFSTSSSTTSIFGASKTSILGSAFTSKGSEEGTTQSDANQEENETTPAPWLPSEVEISNGEEGYDVILEMRVKSFQLVPSSTESTSSENNTSTTTTPKSSSEVSSSLRWSELGKGPLRFLQTSSSSSSSSPSTSSCQKLRVVQRRETAAGAQGTKVILNSWVHPQSKITRPSDHHVQWMTVGSRDGAAVSYLFQVKNPSDAGLLERALKSVNQLPMQETTTIVKDTS
jgi:NUP50 (Nucleoporin 50 kDa)